jgi:hypothetical protein
LDDNPRQLILEHALNRAWQRLDCVMFHDAISTPAGFLRVFFAARPAA